MGFPLARAGDPGFFGEIVSTDPDGHVKANEDEAVKIIAPTYFYRDRHAFPLTWDPAAVLHTELRGSVEKFVNVIRRQVFNVHGDRDCVLCPTLYSLGAQGARAGATLDYWQGALKNKIPRLEFKGRNWDTDSGPMNSRNPTWSSMYPNAVTSTPTAR